MEKEHQESCNINTHVELLSKYKSDLKVFLE